LRGQQQHSTCRAARLPTDPAWLPPPRPHQQRHHHHRLGKTAPQRTVSVPPARAPVTGRVLAGRSPRLPPPCLRAARPRGPCPRARPRCAAATGGPAPARAHNRLLGNAPCLLLAASPPARFAALAASLPLADVLPPGVSSVGRCAARGRAMSSAARPSSERRGSVEGRRNGAGSPPTMRYSSTSKKSGMLLKRGKFLHRDGVFLLHKKSRYLVLEGPKLSCYKKVCGVSLVLPCGVHGSCCCCSMFCIVGLLCPSLCWT